jgi:hypothetical protein
MARTVIATMTFYGSMPEVRVPLALKMAEEARRFGYQVIAVDGGSPDDFVESMRLRGAMVFSQQEKGMGPAHRQVFKLATEAAGPNGTIAWVEAEKWQLISELWRAVAMVKIGMVDLVMPGRTEVGFLSYPPEQMHQEMFCNLALQAITGIEADWFWGPFAANYAAIQHFISFHEENEERSYNGRSVPKIRCIAAGLRVRGVTVDYTHPPEQTAEETGNWKFLERRIVQIGQVTAMAEEAKRLGVGVFRK